MADALLRDDMESESNVGNTESNIESNLGNTKSNIESPVLHGLAPFWPMKSNVENQDFVQLEMRGTPKETIG